MVVRRSVAVLVAGTLGFSGAAFAQTGPSGDPPGRVGRLSYLQGTVSYHDAQADAWSPAAVNTPLTAGDALWTEPNGHDELSISGTRVRMDGDTQLDVAALDDSQTRLQLDQGRLDIKTFALETNQPYQIITPRGIAALKDQGDYYVHAGTTADPTVMGVRSGAAEFQAPNGQTIALRGGEEAQVTGDGDSIQIRKVETAPPPLPTYWAQRDQQINYAPVQYLGADVTGYEDLAAYGSWSNDPDYGQVWAPRAVAADWTPYSTGSWSYVEPYGWSWVDSEPWGFAPYHYGRWAHRGDRWFWVPPERREHSVYAPALVAFVGGTELGLALGVQSRPVGWFPLGPREAYVPPYTADRRYYQRINANARVPEAALNDRWQRAEHHEALRADQHNEQFANHRFATVVSANDFARSRPVQQARLHVAADKIATAPVAAVSAPPAPTMALAAQAAKPGQPQAQATTRPGQPTQPGQPAVAKTRFAAMETIARPTPNAAPQHAAPGPRISSTQPNAQTPGAKPNLPQLAPHAGAAPKPGEPPHPNEQRPGQPPQANQAVQPPRPGEPPHPQANQAQPQHPGQPPKPAEPPHPQANQAVPPAHPGEPPRPSEQHAPQPQVNHAVQAPHQPEPPHPQANVAPQPQAPHAPQPQHQAPPAPAPQAHTAPPPMPQHQAAPPPQMPQAHAAPPPAPHPAAPPPQMQHSAPPPQAQAPHPAPPPAPHPSAPPPQAPHPAPPPQQAQAPHPQPAPPAHPAPQKQEEKK